MKTAKSIRAAQILAALSLAVTGSSAFAASTWNYDFSNAASCGGVADSQTYASITCSSSSGTNNVTLSAYSTTKVMGSTTTTSTAGTQFATANLDWYNGGHIGVQNQTGVDVNSPQHSMDNSGQTDAIMLSFASAVDLDTVKIGWHQTDSDISILRWTGAGAPTVAASNPSAASGNTIANLLANGWALVGNYADLVDNTPKSVNSPANNSSSYWLISAYNSSYGSGCDITNGCTGGDDYVKLSGLAGSSPTNKTPEPGSIALMGIGMLGLLASRRKQRNS